MVAEKLRPELDDTKEQIAADLSSYQNKLQTQLADFQQASEFISLVAKANAEDRQAWDKLFSCANDKASPYAKQCFQVWSTILLSHPPDPPLFTESQVTDWKGFGIQNDPQSITLEQLERIYTTGMSAYDDLPAPQYQEARLTMIDEVGRRDYIPKRDRMMFFLRVAKTDPSLTCVQHAAHWFWQLAGAQNHRMLPFDMEQWWAANEAALK